MLSALQIPSCSPRRIPDLEGMLPDSCPLSVKVFWPFFESAPKSFYLAWVKFEHCNPSSSERGKFHM